MLLIANAYLVDPATGVEGYRDILIEGERIKRIGAVNGSGDCGDGDVTVLDASGLVAAPGLVDVHSHFRDPGYPYKEDIGSGARAAAAGGYTTVVLMANTRPPVDNEETLRYVLEKGSRTGIRIATCATVTEGMKGRRLAPMESLYKSGAAGFTDDGVPVMEEGLVREAMSRAARLRAPISFHEEDPAYIENNGINAGKASAYFGLGGAGRRAETELVERDLKIALETGACVNIQHISSKEAVELVRQAKKRGGDIHAEATPHHFTLTEDALLQYGTLAKMNPPLRTEEDRRAIIEGLKDGTIDLIATDHAPHSAEEKAKPLTEAPSGIIGLETALPLAVTQLVKTGELSLMETVEKLTVNPARMYRLDAGYLEEGGPADLVLFDPEEEYTVRKFWSRSSNSPFAGYRLSGKVRYTICRGRIVYDAARQTEAEADADTAG